MVYITSTMKLVKNSAPLRTAFKYTKLALNENGVFFPPWFLTSGSSSPAFSASSSIKPIKAHLLQLFYSFRVALHVNECLLSRSAQRDRLASSPAACILNDENLSSDDRWRGRRRGYLIKSPRLWKLFQF